MKCHLITIFIFSIFSIGCSSMYNANNPQPKHQKVSYTTPFEVSLIDSCSGSKNELYVKANEWIAKTFGSAKAVIEMQDKEAGKIIGKGNLTCSSTRNRMAVTVENDYVSYTIQIDVKENKYRCIINHFIHEGGVAAALLDPSYKANQQGLGDLDNVRNSERYKLARQETEVKANDILKSLKAAMHSKTDDF